MRRVPLHVALGASLLFATACGVGEDPENTGGEAAGATLTLALGADLDSTDPAALISGGSMQRLRQVVESLTTIDESGALQPELATDWSTSEDGLTWTFELRDDVAFSNGEPFNAEAVKFSIDRLLGGEVVNVRTDAMAVIDETTVVDEHTVEFSLSEPYPALAMAMFQPMAGIIAPGSIEENGNSMEQIVHPVGTGPYVFESNTAGDRLVLERNEDYWGDAPEFATQVWQVVPEPASRMAMLRSGEADIALDPPGTELEGLSADDDFKVELVNLPQVFGLFLNQRSSRTDALQDPAVRRALSKAIDREAIVENLVYGAATAYDGPLPEFDFGYCEQGIHDYDPEAARQALADAGHSDLTLELAAPNGRYLNDYAVGQAVAGNLRDIGVTANLAPATDFPTYLDNIYAEPGKNDYDASMIALGSIFLDGGHALRSYGSTSLPPNGYNGSYYEDDEFDALLDQIDTEADDDRRADLICQAQTKLTEDAASVWLYAPEQPVVMRSDLDNLTALPSSFLDPSTVTAQ